MAEKDFDTSENRDRDHKKEEGRDREGLRENISQKAFDKGAVEVKNANASGDGSYGRNESSIPEEEQRVRKDDSIY